MRMQLSVCAAAILGFGGAALGQTIVVGPAVYPGNGHTYSVVSGWAEWTTARDGAIGMGGYLATISDQAENDFVADLLRQGSRNGDMNGWIGLFDERNTNTFGWVTGEPLNYTNWMFAEPSHQGFGFCAGDENYVEMVPVDAGRWNDVINFCDITGARLAIVESEGGAPECPCETDGNPSVIDVFDLLAYLNLWFAGDRAADRDGNVGIDVFDLLAYLDCWFNPTVVPGCEPE